MPRLSPGQTIAPRVLTTIRSEAVPIPDPTCFVHLQFRRYAGCPICNIHIRSLARRHDEIRAARIREIAVFHSPAEDMLPHHGDLPFAVIADPQRLLYTEFGVEASLHAVLHPRAWTTPLNPSAYPVVLRGLRNGGSPGPRHGETVLGLPADFFIDPAGRVLALRYGRHANDQWSVDELVALASQRSQFGSTATARTPAAPAF
jgi:AhpC/TSA antioxidant enzyme